jgi:ArsR family transcriptional regulator
MAMEQLAQCFKGLAEPIRLRAIRLLDHGELCICDLMNGLDLPQSTMSRHMSFLKNSGWVQSRRKGQWVYYSLADPQQEIQALVLQVLKQNLPELEEARQDYARLMNFLETKDNDNSCAA